MAQTECHPPEEVSFWKALEAQMQCKSSPENTFLLRTHKHVACIPSELLFPSPRLKNAPPWVFPAAKTISYCTFQNADFNKTVLYLWRKLVCFLTEGEGEEVLSIRESNTLLGQPWVWRKTFSWEADQLVRNRMLFPSSHDPPLPTSDSLQLFQFQFVKKKKKGISMCIYKVSQCLCCSTCKALNKCKDLSMAGAYQTSWSAESISSLLGIHKPTAYILRCHIKTHLVVFQHLKHILGSQQFHRLLCTCRHLHSYLLLSWISPSPCC